MVLVIVSVMVLNYVLRFGIVLGKVVNVNGVSMIVVNVWFFVVIISGFIFCSYFFIMLVVKL